VTKVTLHQEEANQFPAIFSINARGRPQIVRPISVQIAFAVD